MKNANPVSWLRGWCALFLVAGLLAGCGRKEPAAPAAPKTVADFFTIQVGGRSVRMQLAVLNAEMERGLMERRNLGSDEGMIFIYQRPQRMSFWMHDTSTPLDIGFFDRSGTLVEVYPMQPFDETTVASRSEQLQFALEMNQGWYSANGVFPGATLDRAALVAALRARDFDPAKFGLK
ncbi:MAG: DUF192 domain-containing protein [Opitutales bacterium]